MLVTETAFEAHDINPNSFGGCVILGIVMCQAYEFYARTQKTINGNALS